MKLFLTFVFCVCSGICLAQEIMIFNFSAIGKKANDSIPLLIAKSDDAIAPTKITIEVSSNLLSAVVLDYPKSVNKEMARQAVNKIFANCEKKLSVQDVYVWRDEKNKIAYEIKPKSLIENEQNAIKEKYLVEFCKQNNIQYKLISDEWFIQNINRVDFNVHPQLKKSFKKFTNV